jgi:hypothetical protein
MQSGFNCTPWRANLGNFLRTLAAPEAIKEWSLTSLREKLIKIDAKVVSHGGTSPSAWPRLPSHAIFSETSCCRSWRRGLPEGRASRLRRSYNRRQGVHPRNEGTRFT